MPTLILGVHNHQPVGNFDHVIRDAHDRAYEPFLALLEEHPGIKMALHCSGPLLEWQKREAPDYLERVGALAQAGRVELFGGGYWEPILAVLPERDQHAQIERMCGELEFLFGRRPRGLWLAERIWEPSLPRLLAEHGLDYVALDDSHFLATGFREEQLRGYYLTEEGGASCAVFPISKQLRYLVPFHPVEKVLAHLGEHGAGELAVLMDDGEKFGVWSSTNLLCYEEGYLGRLFSALEAEPGLTIGGFGDYLDAHPPLGHAYLPTASYSEMGEWALPRGAQAHAQELARMVEDGKPELKPFVRGGFWRNFFVKYEESHWMHKRALWTGRQLARAADEGTAPPAVLAEAEDLKLQAQCNCAYWHGLFGGLYLPHLRHAVFERLLQAEKMALPDGYRLEREDMDLDGREEIVWSGPRARVFLKPGDGGSVRELDFLDKPFPLTNVLARREELYHDKLRELEARTLPDEAQSIHEIVRVKEDGLERYLVYDPHPRASLEERLYPAGAGEAGYAEAWLDFRGQAFRPELPATGDGELLLSGALDFEPGRRLILDKRLSWVDDGAALAVDLRLRYEGEGHLAASFASGWNFNLLAPDAPDRLVLVDGRPAKEARLGSRGWERGIGRIELRDEWSGVSVALAGDGLDVYREPIETVSLSEAGFERVYQGSWLAILREIDLASGEECRLAYRVEMSRLPGNED